MFTPQFSMPIFDTRLWAALRVSRTDREIALTQYEKTVQTAFREVADALAVRGTVDEQLAAQESLTATVADTYRLAEKRYSSGIDSYLTVLDAQRSHFAARQSLVTLRFAKLAAQIQLYAALGGGAES
jgi:multidrug efflux system outer membrane protein